MRRLALLLVTLCGCALMPDPPAGTGWQCWTTIDGPWCARTCGASGEPCFAQPTAWCFANQEPTATGCFGNHPTCVEFSDNIGSLSSGCFEFN